MEDKKSANCGYKLTYWKSEDEEKKEKAERLEAVIAAHQEELAKLCPPKPKPEPRELVELIRSKLVDVALACGGTDKMAEPFQHLKQAADRIEQLEGRNKYLAVIFDAYRIKSEGLKAKNNQLLDQIAELQAEFVKLEIAYNSMQDSNAQKAEAADYFETENKQLTIRIAELVSTLRFTAERLRRFGKSTAEIDGLLEKETNENKS